MKKLIIFVVLVTVCSTALAQNPSYKDKLYYTCKVWGFVKYFHSKVSVCEVNWDDELLSALPKIKNAVTGSDFNDVLIQMLNAAGPMAIATKPLPDTISPELKMNLSFGWFNDPLLRSDVKTILDTIKNNFRPHTNCQVKESDELNGYGWLAFPYDEPIINSDLSKNYPDEFTRLLIICKYWNILKYFNPNNYILETPWDSTLYHNIETFANDSNYSDFVGSFKKMTSKLDDAHVELFSPDFDYSPKLVLRYAENQYVVVKSGYTKICKGDIITSIDGTPTSQLEDSLRQYISAGNPNVFSREVCRKMLLGDMGSYVNIGYKDSLGNAQSVSYARFSPLNNIWFYDYSPNDYISSLKWKKWDCNVGFVNMGMLREMDVKSMYSSLYNTSAMIIDLRNDLEGATWTLADLIYPNKKCFAKLTIPDVKYPGTFYWDYSYFGVDNNPLYYKGKVIILCNQESQSSIEYCTMILRAMPNSIVVGSQTAGADGNITKIFFSNDLSAGFTSLGVYFPDGKQTQRIGIVPDSVVYQTIEGIRHGRDEVFEKAMEIAGCIVSVRDNDIPKSDFSVYPNPVNQNLMIDYSANNSSPISIKICNSLGITVFEEHNINNSGNNYSINISKDDLTPGIYFITIISDNHSGTKKFVVN